MCIPRSEILDASDHETYTQVYDSVYDVSDKHFRILESLASGETTTADASTEKLGRASHTVYSQLGALYRQVRLSGGEGRMRRSLVSALMIFVACDRLVITADPSSYLDTRLKQEYEDVVGKIVLGHSNPVIAAELGLANKTVRNRIWSAGEQVGVSGGAVPLVVSQFSGGHLAIVND